MLQAIGLTSSPRRDLPPAVDDLTFDARPGQVTALLGPAESGKTTTLRLMLQLEPGRGVTYFRGRPLQRIAHPAGEVGVLFGDVPGHPSRTLRSQLRMLSAAAGAPASRADEMLEFVGLAGLRDQRVGRLSRGMDRRLGLASALLGEPHTLLLDEPGAGLSARERAWLHELLRAHATEGGTVLYTTEDPKDAARNADRVVTLDKGRLVAAQDAADFAHSRLRPRVAVRTPHAARLAAAVTQEARAARRTVEVITERGNRLSVYGSDCAAIGETAFRHGVLIHRLTDEVGDTHLVASGAPADADRLPVTERRPVPAARPSEPRRPVRSPLRPLTYEIRRLLGVPATPLVAAAVLVASVVISVLLARSGRTPMPTVLAGWPALSPLPPAALGAGLLGAFSFGDEYRYPALTTGRGVVPRRLGLLLAKLTVAAAVAVVLAVLVVVADLEALRLVYGGDLIPVPENWPALCASWLGLTVGCAWAGVLGAGVFRVAAAGVAAVLAVPVVVAPLLRQATSGPAGRSIAGLPGRLREFVSAEWPAAADRWLLGALRVVAQPVGVALAVALTALLCAYVISGLHRKAHW
ncbi:ATP-binding cassette domain-containing protein [Streptomyces sp. P9(2023)]|uniref:ATP-binding cassette domain-containing protein n=1 Tax=Streptomyces sp. P9(2023) TaxID=3064394 RepID=UPI0028F4424B|nr:ATP-binding cassette domain-containing protein [Streptomyces sp. P9(2023)]MDT9690417.1 ATP-binding cassette domain-containing protein [Streptomyces sp. P9(2023)]